MGLWAYASLYCQQASAGTIHYHTMIKSTLESVLKRAPESLLESSLESPLERVLRANSFLLQEALR